MELLSLFATLVSGLVAWYFWALFSSYQKARSIGMPIVITPINPQYFLWVVFSVPLRPLIQEYFPESLAFSLNLSTYGFEFQLGYKPCEKLGDSYVLVGPGYREIWTSDPEIVKSILGSTKQFNQSELSRRFMEVFGPNAISSNGEVWQRQRKVIAPIVNERISRSVWQESQEQASTLTQHFLQQSQSKSATEPDGTVAGLRRVAINVLAAAGYGQPQSWTPHASEEIPEGHSMSYIGSLLVVIQLMPFAVFFPKWLLSLSFMPTSIQKLAQALDEFPAYTKELVAKERASGDSKQGSLLSIVVQASDQGKKDAASRVYLSEHEIEGNMFLFTVAGLDTTANSMAFAISLMAIHQKWQDWLIEEVDQVLSKDNAVAYEDAFPKLKRMLAFMFETLRLYTPLSHMTRVPVGDQIVTSSDGHTYTLSEGLDVFTSFAMMHKNPKLWGADVDEFRPTRWLSEDGSIVQPERRIFSPWGQGPRSCPGMKMAQVEFVATMANVLRRARVRPVVGEGETREAAVKRLEAVMRDSQPLITLEMMRPTDIKLEWVGR